MLKMFTKTSLLLSLTLLLACTVAVVTVVSSVTPSSAKSVQLQPYVNPGVAAISALNKTNGLLDQDMVAHYLESPNTVLAPTLVVEPSPSIQEITITDLSNLVHTQ